MAADVGEFDLCYWVSVGAGCCAGFCMEVFVVVLVKVRRRGRGEALEVNLPLWQTPV